MSAIVVGKNIVAAYEPLPTDSSVMSQVGANRSFRNITGYEAAVMEAIAAAAATDSNVAVVPMDVRDYVQLATGMPLEQFAKTLPASCLEELRILAIDACEEALRYCDDTAVRVEAAGVLSKLGVIGYRERYGKQPQRTRNVATVRAALAGIDHAARARRFAVACGWQRRADGT